MASNLVPRGALAAIAGASLAVMASTGPSSAFTLSGPSIATPAASAGVEHVWWDRWGRWHRNRPWGWRRWGWGPRPGLYGFYRPMRRCWVSPWGGVRCHWV